MLSKGDKVAHYTIESRLGVGGMGEVYLAKDERLHRNVALKVILEKIEDIGSDGSSRGAQDASARLVREARAAASLAHPNVVSVFDVGEHEGRVYLAMEYVVGKTLREMMRQNTVAWPKRLRWLTDVARALAAAHKSGLVHRDIKPENVMVREDGIIKVLDFGIARRILGPGIDPNGRTEAAGMSTLTGAGVIIGTPMYMAPEQIKGGVADTRTDQFAWGVMAYEVLSGDRPWPDKSDLLAAVAMILTEPPASLRARVPELPPAVETVVARTIARDPSQRFDGMDEVADALEPLATSIPSQQPITAASPKVGELTAHESPKAKDKDPITKGALVTRLSPEFPGHPQERPQKKRRWHFLLGIATALLAVGGYYKFIRKPLPVVIARPVVSVSQKLPDPVLDVQSPEALRAYQDGLQFWRDGASTRSRVSLEHAVELENSLAAAHLLLALQQLDIDSASSQDHFQKAFSHRVSLSDRDRVVLEALAPLLRPTADVGEAQAKLLEATKKSPNEALYFYLLGNVHQQRSEYELASADFRECVRLDPAFMPGWRAEGDAERQLGNVDVALAAYDTCVKSSPAAAICLDQRIGLLRDRGECDRLEQDARSWQSVEPEAPNASYWLADALLARGAKLESVEAALKRQWDAMPKDARAAGEPEDRANLAIFQGDFIEAERQTKDWEKAITRQEVMMHAAPTHQLALLDFETGDVQTAGKVADEFLRVMPALTPDPNGNDPSMWFDEYLYRSKRIDKDELNKRRKEWMTAQELGKTQRENQRMAPFRWAMIYAGFAESMEEAKDALDILPQFLPLPPDARRTPIFNASVGKAYALAGNYDDALPLLKMVTEACIALDMPEVQTRSYYFLGLAMEGKGDLVGAKKAYSVVVERWGKARPKSVTADKAGARLKQLE